MNLLKITPEIAEQLDSQFDEYCADLDRDFTTEEENISNALYALKTIPSILKSIEVDESNPIYKDCLSIEYERLTRLVSCLFKGAADLEDYLIKIGFQL